MKAVEIYTDGACSGNPGVGGWAAVLIYNGREKEISGYVKETTNNRMELFAIISGLSILKEACRVTVYSDSAYAVDAFNKKWLNAWQANNWKTADKKDVKNRDLWNDLLNQLKPHAVTFVKVKGHSDNVYNNRCDELARGEIKKYVSLE
ncbi:MAG: ribonuclease HI [Firmicutes bacterium]|nr:ribonuclease HI [Bacillota bacterium]